MLENVQEKKKRYKTKNKGRKQLDYIMVVRKMITQRKKKRKKKSPWLDSSHSMSL